MKKQEEKIELNSKNKKLVFVYNANSGLMNSAFDSIHKVFSPKTYSCNLCELTYGALTVKKGWKEFLETINMPIEFLHKDELLKKYDKSDTKLPVIFNENEDKELSIFVSAEEINNVETLDDLKELIRNKLKK